MFSLSVLVIGLIERHLVAKATYCTFKLSESGAASSRVMLNCTFVKKKEKKDI